MIDAHAVIADLETLQTVTAEAGNSQPRGLEWVQQQLQSLPVQHTTDAAGNHWFTLRGKQERAVALGGSLGASTAEAGLDSRLGVVTGVETLRALARRSAEAPACTMKLVLWAEPGEQSSAAAANLTSEKISAYLELHVEPGSQLQQAGTPLGVVAPAVEPGAATFHPRLTTLCDEAIRELTGTSASLAAGPAPHALAMARTGIPTALMYVQALAPSHDAQGAAELRLHTLQAAEAFGRWAESTMHLVAGDEVDLWAREQRVPHS